MEDRSTFIAARITASERGKASRLSNRPAVGLKYRGVAPLASRSRFWASATVLSLTAILLASSPVHAQQSVDQILCGNEIYRNANPDCARFASPQQIALEGLFQAGVAAMKSGQWDTAIASFMKLVDADPNYKDAYFALYSIGVAYKAKRDFAHAIPFFDTAIAKDPSIAMAYEGRGDAYSDLGNSKAALADLDRAISLEPKRASGYAARARQKLKDRDANGALADLDRAIELNPRDSRSLYGRSLIRGNARNYDLALADLSKAIEIDPGFSAAYTQRGMIYVQSGKPDQARDAFNAALKLNPGDTVARQALAALQAKKN
jgi:tetratricopeptide (TPR) repeat protein